MDIQTTPSQNLILGLIFTLASLLRSYLIRRGFANWNCF